MKALAPNHVLASYEGAEQVPRRPPDERGVLLPVVVVHTPQVSASFPFEPPHRWRTRPQGSSSTIPVLADGPHHVLRGNPVEQGLKPMNMVLQLLQFLSDRKSVV